MDETPNHQRLAELFQHLMTNSLAAIGFLFAVQGVASFPRSALSNWAIGLFGAAVIFGLFGYVAITSLSLGERPRYDWKIFYPKSWFYPTWIAFMLGVALCLFIAIS
jgi:hypothetical protein